MTGFKADQIVNRIAEDNPIPIGPEHTYRYFYHIDRSKALETSGTHVISITITDDHQRQRTRKISFTVVAFPRITDLELRYKYQNDKNFSS